MKHLLRYLIVILLILAGVLLRGRHLNRPILETHTWRQTETAALARNYAEEGYHLFYPTVDWRGATPGYIESELSIYAFTVALAYGLFGIHEFIARLIALMVWTWTAALLFNIGRRAFGYRAALGTLAFFAFLSPFSFFFGSAIMGDLTAQMFLLLSIYAAQRWQTNGRLGWLALAVVGATCGGLSKLPSLYIGIPLAIIVFQREGLKALIRPPNWLAALATLGIVGAWYWHAYQMGLQTGLSFKIIGLSDDKIGHWSLLVDPVFYQALLYNFTWRLLTTFGLGLALLGMILPRRSRFEIPMLGWVLAALAYFLVAGSGVIVQDYYTLALLPPAVLFIGKSLDAIITWVAQWPRPGKQLLLKLSSIVICLAGLFQSATQTMASTQDMLQTREAALHAWLTGQWVQAALPQDGGLMTLGTGIPEGLYYSHRHGLELEGRVPALSSEDLDQLAQAHWKYLVVFNPYWGNIDEPWLRKLHAERRLLGGGPWFLTYDISQKPVSAPQPQFEPPPQWGGQISLLSYEIIHDQFVDSKLHLILYWQSNQKMTREYVGFAHAWTTADGFCGQDDHEPLKGLYPHRLWEVGQVYADPFEIDLAACPQEQTLVIRVGLYENESHERLPLTTEQSEDQLYTFTINLNGSKAASSH